MTEPTLNLRAHAKVNLALAVGAPEPPTAPKPGYHRIASWFACVGLFDDVEIALRGAGKASTHLIEWASDAPRPSPIDWPIDKDLGVRAHRALERLVGRDLPLALRIRKRIPVGGGLGGGSSNAAAVLQGVNRVFELGLSTDALSTVAQTLGSDVVYFLRVAKGEHAPPPALVEGFGEIIMPRGRVYALVALFFPPFGCPTGEVYRAFDHGAPPALDASRVSELVDRAASGAPVKPASLFNDLALPAERVQPALGPLRARLAEGLGVPVHVTGSGSTLFAIAAEAAQVHRMVDQARRIDPTLSAIATTLV